MAWPRLDGTHLKVHRPERDQDAIFCNCNPCGGFWRLHHHVLHQAVQRLAGDRPCLLCKVYLAEAHICTLLCFISLERIFAPSSVRTIGDRTFLQTEWMVFAHLPNELKLIGGYAFCCSSALVNLWLPTCCINNAGHDKPLLMLLSLKIPLTVHRLGFQALLGCIHLRNVSTPPQHPIGWTLFLWLQWPPEGTRPLLRWQGHYSTRIEEPICWSSNTWDNVPLILLYQWVGRGWNWQSGKHHEVVR